MTKVQAIMRFFEMDSKVAISEIKALSREEKEELGRLALEALGETETDVNGKPIATAASSE